MTCVEMHGIKTRARKQTTDQAVFAIATISYVKGNWSDCTHVRARHFFQKQRTENVTIGFDLKLAHMISSFGMDKRLIFGYLDLLCIRLGKTRIICGQ